jgi:hypothetical protein
MVVSAHNYFAERFRRIDGDRDTVIAAMVVLGFTLVSDEVGQVRRAFGGRVPISHIILGRRTVADPTWAIAMGAIKVALDQAKETVIHVLAPTRVEAQQRELAAYCPTVGWLYTLSTPSLGVRNNSLGSLEKLIQADGSLCQFISYDPATESAAAAPTVSTAAETYDLSGADEDADSVTLNMAVQQDLATPEETSFTAARAIVNASAGPYVLQNGWVLSTGIDTVGPFDVEIESTAATMDSTIAETYVVVNGQICEFIVDGVAVQFAIDATNYAVPAAATAAEFAADALGNAGIAAVLMFADAAGKVRVTTLSEGHGSSVAIGGNTTAALAAVFAFPAGGAVGTGNVANVDAVTAEELALLNAVESGLLYMSDEAGTTRMRSDVMGTAAKVTIYVASSAGLLAAMGLVVGVTAGTGDAQNASQVTSAELFAATSADITGPTYTDEGTLVKLVGTLGSGSLHYLYLVGSLADALGIAGTYFGEGVVDDWADAALVGARAGLALDQAPPDAGHLTFNNVAVLGMYGTRTLTIPEQQRLNRTQHVNTLVLLSVARGPEFHDGRLSIPFASGAPTYTDQWIATHWLALYMANVLSARLNSVADSGNQLAYYSETAYAPFVLTAIQDAEAVAVQSKALAFVDTTTPTASKPTGVIVVPKTQLSPSQQQLRIGLIRVRAKLAAALHGLIVEIVLEA